jgi:hypothetical protein
MARKGARKSPAGDANRIETSSAPSKSRQIRRRARLTYWMARYDGLISVALTRLKRSPNGMARYMACSLSTPRAIPSGPA